jgi:epoxyqueuosine reductase
MTLLHVCCGPCAVYPGMVLKKDGIKFDAYFYNPNIHPENEFKLRMHNVRIWAEKTDVRLIASDEYDEKPWLELGDDKISRCRMCYGARIRNVCLYARDHGYRHVTTTLLVSPYQDHEMIIRLFDDISEEYNLEFLYYDFRTGYRLGQSMAKEMGLYRQKYCGCLPSIKESSYFSKNRNCKG